MNWRRVVNTWGAVGSRGRGRLLAGAAVALLLLGGGQAARAQGVSVDSATPSAAEQGTVNLDVVVTGAGFERGARASFFVTGTTDPGGVTVNSTTYRSSSRLIANIDVALDASATPFDVAVYLRDGRHGIGVEKFRVDRKPPPEYHLVVLQGGTSNEQGSLVYGLSDSGVAAGSWFSPASAEACGTRIMAVWEAIGPTTASPKVPDFTDPVCPECSSQAFGIDPTGVLVAGTACDASDLTGPCTCPQRAAVWELSSSSWVRTYLEGPSPAGDSTADAAAVVDGTEMVAGMLPGGVPVLWRKWSGSWVRQSLPLGSAIGGRPQDMNAMGLVVGLVSLPGSGSYVHRLWSCSPDPAAGCSGPHDLPLGGLNSITSASDVDSNGNVAGAGTRASDGATVAAVWSFLGYDLGTNPPTPTWSGPDLTLPGLGGSTRARSGETVATTVTVVGAATQPAPKKNSPATDHVVRWRWLGTSWSAPYKYEDKDDSLDWAPASGGDVRHIRLAASGQMSSRCVELRPTPLYAYQGCIEVPVP